MASNYYERQGKREWWSVHVEAWQRSGLTQIKYCNIHGLERGTFSRWLNALTDAKMAKLRVERVAAERNQSRKNKPLKLSSDKRNQAVQAYWAMHVEALNWSGLTIREYAKALRLSPWSLGRWRDLIADEEVVIDWRAQLHPSARPQISTGFSTSANGLAVESDLTDAYVANPARAGKSNRRSFTDDEKRAIVLETLRPDATVSKVAREHHIVTSMVFRWRVQFGFAGDDSAKLTPVRMADAQHEGRSRDSAPPAMLHDLLPVPDGMVAVDLPDGRRVFAPADADPEQVRAQVAVMELQP